MTRGKGRNPGAGNLNKHIKRKEHKERGQLAARKHLGQLEKHKDHVQRAKKRRLKVERLQTIKRAAAQRNPDEFNIGMTRAVMDVASGRMKRRRKSQLPQERAADLKKVMNGNARNVQYLEFKAKADIMRATDLLEEDGAAAITAVKPQNTHTVFVESEEEFKKFNPLQYFDTTKEMLLQHPAVRGKLSILKNTVLPDEVVLSGGHTMKSISQKRKERRELTRKLRALGADADARESLLEHARAKRALKPYRFADLLAEDDVARRVHAQSGNGKGGAGGEDHHDDDDEEGNDIEHHHSNDGGARGKASSSPKDDIAQLLEWRREKERQETVAAARRLREVTQRVERSRSLSTLAKVVRRQMNGIKKQLQQKSDSRFKPSAARRSR